MSRRMPARALKPRGSALNGLEAGASAFEGMLVIRMIAEGSFALRRAILNALHALGAPPPRAFTL